MHPLRYGFLFSLIVLGISCIPAENTSLVAPEGADWAAEVVWYQIFPERFRNGDAANDPVPQDMAGGWPYFTPKDWQISPWTSDWYAFQPWEQGIEWHAHFDWAKEGEANFGATAGLRRYGGDLQGIIDQLTYLEDLGITGIYLNPVFESPSLHKYNASSYHHVDNNFGPDPQGDAAIWATEDPADPSTWKWTSADKLFLKLIEECHKRNIRVVLDGVFNHVGRRFWAFEDVVKNQQKSPYRDWFSITRWDNPETAENEFAYEGWLGIRDLPEFVESDSGFEPGVTEHFKHIVRRWMDPNGDGDPSDGIDGWRLDVAEKVRVEFWKEFRTWVREINPNAYLVGEVWWEDYDKNRMFNAAPWFDGAFDAVKNYRFSRAVKQLVIDEKTKVSASAFVDTMQTIFSDYPDNKYLVWNMLSGHDVDRLASQIQNPDRWYDHAGDVMNNPDYVIQKPSQMQREMQKNIIAMQMTLPGAPLIYYGDEVGMWGGDDPSCRKPMVWPDFNYSVEKSHPDVNKTRPADKVSVDVEMLQFYKDLIDIRGENRCLSIGETQFLTFDDPHVLAYWRSLEENQLLIILNSSAEPGQFTLNSDELQGYTKFLSLTNNVGIEATEGALGFRLMPYQMMILQPEN
ncbi:MAG: glycoside hydrolase family 13 protein [Calditrichia bacterium]